MHPSSKKHTGSKFRGGGRSDFISGHKWGAPILGFIAFLSTSFFGKFEWGGTMI
jgi:hypothetical protein